MTIEAISELSAQDRQCLAAWLHELDYDDWDWQMVTDFSPGGRGQALLDRIRREIAAGQATRFDDGLPANEKQNPQRQ